MPLIKNKDLEKIAVKMNGAKNVVKQTPISGKEGWDGWSMRIFSLAKDGYTPSHAHPWPHINYIIKGTGTLFIDGEEKPVAAGDTAYIKGNEDHQFKNAGDDEFSFICIVPEEGDR